MRLKRKTDTLNHEPLDLGPVPLGPGPWTLPLNPKPPKSLGAEAETPKSRRAELKEAAGGEGLGYIGLLDSELRWGPGMVWTPFERLVLL